MNREEYNQCIKNKLPALKEEIPHRTKFCVAAKLCSGKTKDISDAIEVCKIPKEKSDRGKICDTEKIVNCVIKNIDRKKDFREELIRTVNLCICEPPVRRSKAQEKREFLGQYGFNTGEVK